MIYKAEKIVPYAANEAPKSVQVERMFDEIAGKYDFLNHTLSLGIDKRWRKEGILTLRDLFPQNILDIATGTGDLALEAYRLLHPEKIVGIDISEKMMDVGREKIAQVGLAGKISFEWQNCSGLQMNDNIFDAAIMAFGIRNFENLDKSLQEILRVLRPGGRLMFLELSTPEYFPMKQGYKIYSQLIPFIGQWISRSKAAYRYLPESIAAFPQNADLKAIMEKNGFIGTKYRKLSFGLCTLYSGEKAANCSSVSFSPSKTA
ncbi:MAG: bifunctional demethylmenaquinone methyltransferase/2-methoxy-6-polyprenyl-1,4-benzoquinol methylase UbiE [Candidatus Symbiothrix sp.]|jgi:demethylmenaquinone methyltransferase/2-methoxy-6-polyprenyl-1,4-benzoquinol methylase|nr:bifunctional demethylmenaquinone methyltransferase/2-methoxy-6-polyprenyl-1,4-benzoquinol methylase UbiE [Candidatus Symbiothrix sp.]